MSNDLVSEELRAAERDIDAHHLANPLFQQPFSVAAQWFLAICEEHHVREMLRRHATNHQEFTAIVDNIVVHAKWPLRWLTQACPKSSALTWEYNDALYTATWQLSEHSTEYLAFEAAFSYATFGLLRLTLEDKRIKVTGPMCDDIRFDAYDRLTSSPNIPYNGQAHSFFERGALRDSYS